MTLQDSGERREFETGAVRDMAAGKGRYDLIPYDMLRRLALIYEKGAIKYGEQNWQKGIPLATYIDSAMRHLQKAAAGLEDEDHAAQAVWNLFSYMWTLDQIKQGKLPRKLDNRPYVVPTISIPTVWTVPDNKEGDEYTLTTTITNGTEPQTWVFREGQWVNKGE